MDSKQEWTYFQQCFFQLGVPLYNTEQPLQGIELQEKEKEQDEKDVQ